MRQWVVERVEFGPSLFTFVRIDCASQLGGIVMFKALTNDLKPLVRWFGVGVSILSILFAISTNYGLWNELRGDNLAAAVASRFDKSYAEDASIPVRNGDKAWPPLVRLIERYSHADLPKDKKPLVLARLKAIAAAKVEPFEWTAPTTPLLLLYKEWPNHGDVGPEDMRIVGTIGDLHDWIRADQSDFDFFYRTIIFGILSACVGIFLALPDAPKRQPS
jgi:hypothetical protein